ncbi:hypothetical protein SAMN06893096_111120 [Geodermatophilus pulveris]|uniref:Uncharacterized protein n=1 Tax=Geodermatophilus pulveris TaxID=1564159 RepID=A0A239IRF6_9ACTN|nr:hypothetical protein SAMN06893096_111120 [Geodermatophilus pulveris]
MDVTGSVTPVTAAAGAAPGRSLVSHLPWHARAGVGRLQA